MRVAVTGATGFVGSALLPRLSAAGHDVSRVVRSPRGDDTDILWDPAAGKLEPADLADIDGVVHLAGESIAGVWTAGRRARIYDSRITGTRLLVQALTARPRPRVLVTASAIGYYGDRGDEQLDEASSPGSGFLAGLCRDWEGEAAQAAESGARVVAARFGVIQAPWAGMLKAMLFAAKVGPVARFGHGRRYQSWVAVDDLVRALVFSLGAESLSGPVNVTAPHPVTNAEYAATLARIVHRPVVPVPPVLLRTVLREVADELLLQSARVLPARLLDHGFTFDHPTLDGALRALMANAAP